MFEDRELVAEFVNESREHLADIEGQLLQIEAAGGDSDLVNEVFRAVHSIKGAAGFMGFSTLGKLAHELENILNLMRNGQLAASSATIDTMLKAADKLRWLIENIENSNAADISEHLLALELVVAGLNASDSGSAETVAKAEPAERLEAVAAVAVPAEAVTNAADVIAQIPAVEAVEVKAKPNPAETHSPGPAADTSIRVGVGVLDKLMTLAGELVLSRNQLLQTLATKDASKLDSVSARVDQVTTDLHETVMQARMQVVGTVFNRFPRVVRDLSGKLGKQCELKIEGAEVELDKSIIEAIGDPLTHLVRNAVDHGVESPEQRLAAGKPAKATVVLRAYHQAGKVNISISDDGAGVDVARLKQKAVSRGLLTPEQARSINEREALSLIFRPGFSTAEKVTDVSGRGVGMDVVKTNIERVGGNVSVETEIGKGTTVQVRLPLTLAIIPCLIVHSGGRRYAIPQSSICELVRVKRSEMEARIQRLKDAEVLRLRGTLLPLVRLDSVLAIDRTDNTKPQAAENIVVAEAGHMRFGLVVDGLHDSEEIVVKPLGRHMRNCPCLAGATILGDGEAALILDPAGIAAFSKLRPPQEATSGEDRDGAVAAKGDVQTLLLFRNDPADQFAIPMHLVARLERIRAMQIDSVGGSKVLQYRGGSLPLLSLEDTIAARPMPESETMFVVVFTLGGREVGLLIREVVDIHSTSAAINGTLFRQPGVIGSMVIDSRTTRLLDLCELVSAAHPDWVLPNAAAAEDSPRAETILLAEDSDFFRQRLVEVFETAGYRVVACPDGAVAWKTFQDASQTFDLVVTDLEMPHVDGFELVRRIRQHPIGGNLPVFAVSSLASEEDQQRARKAGVDEYHIKLDRESLVEAIAAHLRQGMQRLTSKI
jgi:two-component system, chemotaxis family, sensor kinase CheA